jgi:type I restriction enzyme S subunit
MENNLPKGWELKSIGEIAATTCGGTPSRSNKKYWGGKVPWLKSGELNDGKITTNEEFITEEGLSGSNAKIFPKGSLLLALYGATAGRLGFLDFDSSTNQAVCWINSEKNKVDKHYVFYYLLAKRSQIIKDSFGGAQPNISQAYIRNLPIPLPPLSEQQRIVAKLDRLFERIDKAIALVEENISHTEHLLDASYNNILNQLEGQQSVLDNIMTFNPPKSEVNNIHDVEVSFLPMADLSERKIKALPKQARKIEDVRAGYTYFKEGDVLLAKVTPCFENGKSGIATGLKNGIGFGSSEFYVLRAKNEVLPDFIYYVVSASDFLRKGAEKMSGAVGLKRVVKDFVKGYPILLPSIEVQRKICGYLDKIKEKQQSLLHQQTTRLLELKQLKSSLLNSAFKGEM